MIFSSEHPPLHIDIVAIEKEAFGSPTTMVANFTYFIWKKVVFCNWKPALSNCIIVYLPPTAHPAKDRRWRKAHFKAVLNFEFSFF